MEIGIAQINPTVGDLEGNQRRLKKAYTQLVNDGADLIVAPELALCGYPPRDLLFKSHFIEDMSEALNELTSNVGNVPLVVGTVIKKGLDCYNAAAWCENGSIKAYGCKTLLPNYDVFDEVRYFKAADGPLIHNWKGKRIALTICEDIWTPSDVTQGHSYEFDPIAYIKQSGVDLILNLSASPWHSGKSEQREHLVLSVAEQCGCPIVYCNAVGGNDELVFDGGSIIADPKRGILAGLSAFKEDFSVIEIGNSWKPVVSEHYNPIGISAVHHALVLGLRDYVEKSGFKRVLLGLSGGIDSAVVCALAVEALGAENVTGIALPSAISSEHSRQDAADLANNLGISFHEISIKETVTAAETALQPLFKDLDRDVTEENIQARTRGLLLMALSNKYGALLLTTGNKSEIAVGYCTLYGDMCGGLSVISDLPKMKVYALARYINESGQIIPLSTIEKAPSAELSPDQIDSDSLPDYPILDGILQLYIEDGLSRAKITAKGYDRSVVNRITRLVDLNEYKRKQAAPGLKITSIAFGVGRRIPIVQKYIN